MKVLSTQVGYEPTQLGHASVRLMASGAAAGAL